MTKYDDGRRFEWKVRDALEADGYDVIRSAGSKTKVDLVAFKPGQCVMVQAKRDGKISPAERTELLRVAAHIAALPIVAWKVNGSSRIHYSRLTGTGPADRIEWRPDEVGA
jgi:holliday junction resolvase Hjr